MKRIISLMLTLAVALSLLILPAGAASTPEEALGEVNIYSGGYSMNYLAVNGRVQTQSYTYFLYRNSVGETQEIPAYCVTPDQYGVPQTVPEGESIRYLAEEKASDSKVVGLVANMYPHRSLAELGLSNKYQAFYAGKIALWCYLIRVGYQRRHRSPRPYRPGEGDWGKHSRCRGQNLYSGYHMDQCGRAPAHHLPRSGGSLPRHH